ncbi:hypothetical protein OO012_13970 [Rhodobacteraceae bacterium KMM 6894]|nr:hypothetical protein [Rhodobacteraceae bacterium KMM 6894]
MTKIALLVALILILPTGPVHADAIIGGQTVDCYCTDKTGSRLELGDMTCLHVDGKMFMAQCQMSLNVPMWRKISDGCLSSALPRSLQPPHDAISIHPHI